MSEKKSPGQKLRDLIATGETILLPGAHDPLMGRIVQRLGFKACICAGWMTGAHLATPEPVMTMTEQVDAAGRVARAVDIPVKSDAGAGYGDPIHVIRAVQEFERAGIAAIQIEDQVFPKRASYHRGLEHVTELDEFLRKIEFAMKAREDDIVIFRAHRRRERGRRLVEGGRPPHQGPQGAGSGRGPSDDPHEGEHGAVPSGVPR